MPDSPVKPCAVCGGECDGKPRIKDAKGRYFHKKCAEAKKSPGAKERKNPYQAPAGGVMDLLVDDAIANAPEPCPNCGKPLAREATLCVQCGFNTTTGKALKSRVERVKASPSGSAKSAGVARGAAAASSAAFGPVFWIVGGVIGGGIGAAIWATLVYQLQVEMAWIAMITGLLTGTGVFMGTRGQGGFMPGILSVVIAVCAILVGKYAGVSLLVDEFAEDIAYGDANGRFTAANVEDSQIFHEISVEIVEERLDQGVPIEWPEQTLYLIESGYQPFDFDFEDEFEDDGSQEMAEADPVDMDDPIAVGRAALDGAAEWPKGFPKELRRDAMARWEETPETQREYRREDIAAQLNAEAELFTETFAEVVKPVGFLYTFGLFDIVFFGIAIAVAWAIGGKGDFS